jgi:hypothetical protein
MNTHRIEELLETLIYKQVEIIERLESVEARMVDVIGETNSDVKNILYWMIQTSDSLGNIEATSAEVSASLAKIR